MGDRSKRDLAADQTMGEKTLAEDNSKLYEKERKEREQERLQRHKTIGVVIDAVLDAIAEAVHQVGGATTTPALDRLMVLARGLSDPADEDTEKFVGALPTVALAIAERTHPSPSETRPARDAFVRFVQALDDADNGFPEQPAA